MKTKYLIIGAGVSGLSFATAVDDYLIIEKEDEPGGLCRTIKRNGYTWDYSGHFFHFQDSKIKQMFMDKLDASELITQNKCTKIYRKGKLIDFPFQKNIHQLDKEDFIDCLYDLYFKQEKDVYSNFEDMLYGKFGKSITEMFLKPYNQKLYACELDSLDIDAMGRFFPYADMDDIIRNMKKESDDSYNSTFLYPKGGAEVFIDALVKQLDSDKLRLNCELLEIDTEKKTAVTSQGEIQYDYLINTMPLNRFAKMLGENIRCYSSNKVLVFNLGFNQKSKYTDVHWIYFPENLYNFYRVGFYDNILNQDRLSLYVEIGFSEDAVINTDEELVKTLEGLRRIGISEGLTLEDYHFVIMNPAYVHITKESEIQKKQFLEDLKKKGIYSLGRYGSWTYCSIEDCVKEALKTAKG